MKLPIDHSAVRFLIAAMVMMTFMILIWMPLAIMWVGPWFYEGALVGSLAWRKATYLNLLFNIFPVLLLFGYILITLLRDARREKAEHEKAQAEYRHLPTVLDAEKKG